MKIPIPSFYLSYIGQLTTTPLEEVGPQYSVSKCIKTLPRSPVYWDSSFNRAIVNPLLMGIKLKPSSNKNFNNLFLLFVQTARKKLTVKVIFNAPIYWLFHDTWHTAQLFTRGVKIKKWSQPTTFPSV